MSDATRTQIGIVEETTFGTTPSNPAFETLRITAANLADAKQTVVSKELRSDAQITDRITTMFQPGGDLPGEVSYGSIDTALRGSMRSDWVYAPVRDNNGTAASNITSVSSTDVNIIAHDNTSAFKYGTPAVGHLVRTSGFTAAGNNALRRAGAGTLDTVIKLSSGTVDAAPVAAARAKVVGAEGASGDITASSTGLASTALDFTTLGLAKGMWVYVGGPGAGQSFATAAVAGWARVSAIAATALTFDILPSGWTTDSGTSKTIRFYWGDYIRNGTSYRSYTVEQQFTDLATPTYEYYRGMRPTMFEIDAKSASILTWKVTFMGKKASGATDTQSFTARISGATDVAANTNDVMNASDNVGLLYVNGAVLPAPNYVTGVTLTINDQGRRNEAVGFNTAQDIKYGQFNCTAKLNTYYGDPTVLTWIRNSTAVSWNGVFTDPTTATKAYVFDVPRLKFGDGNPSVPGIDQDRMLDTDFQALRHLTLGYTLQVQRLEEYNT